MTWLEWWCFDVDDDKEELVAALAEAEGAALPVSQEEEEDVVFEFELALDDEAALLALS